MSPRVRGGRPDRPAPLSLLTITSVAGRPFWHRLAALFLRWEFLERVERRQCL